MDQDEFSKWLTVQSDTTRAAMASRASGRALPGVSAFTGPNFNALALTHFRATLCAATCANRPGFKERLGIQNRSSAFRRLYWAADASDTTTHPHTISAQGALRSVCVPPVPDNHRDEDTLATALFSGSARYFSQNEANEAATKMLFDDATRQSFSGSLWAFNPPRYFVNLQKVFLQRLQDEAGLWSWWEDWYLKFRFGETNDWDFAAKVALIGDEIWEEGPKAVSDEVRRLNRVVRLGEKLSLDGSEPRSVQHLFERPSFVRTSMSSLSATVTQHFDAFDKLTKPNEALFFDDLRALPSIAFGIETLVGTANQDRATVDELKHKVGQFQARIIALEKELSAARAEIDTLKAKRWYRAASVTIGAATVMGLLVNAMRVLSGDELGVQGRVENLLDDWNYVFPADEQPEEPLPLSIDNIETHEV